MYIYIYIHKHSCRCHVLLIAPCARCDPAQGIPNRFTPACLAERHAGSICPSPCITKEMSRAADLLNDSVHGDNEQPSIQVNVSIGSDDYSSSVCC